ncbi:hypothetical protein DDB_G0272494 [Dictyostelium discoideum AX4]|uniref:Uncharacterized protein n=1 Tax=Dictyostelium discoideum TaxID=44689 RepID=Q7KWV1_DICDI|nr:hypothetical protein DDB_G0272494 [Dictyostelium discoideum AX4]EAL71171.1 hypothetical protein DDB_G0272494 [Dictyostelium discoideum AX4]|eukprot:XP_645107.1 hypothetical protein DDB_G0272494 [Dictyostelium discoideum AX4]
MTKLSSVGLLSLVGVSLVAGDHYSCDQMKKLSHEYFPESVADNMICLSFHSSGWNSISNTKNSIGLWYKLMHNVAEMVYTEFGYNHWDAWNKGKCNGWNQCGISTSVNGDDNVGAAITGSGGVSGSGSGSVVDVKDNGDVKAAITGSGGVSGDNDVKAAITGSGGVSGSDDVVKAAITGSGGVSGSGRGSVVDVKDNGDVNAAITGSGGVSGSGSTIPVMAAITGTGSSGSGTTIPVKSEVFSATGDSTIPVLEDVQAAITGSGGVSGSGSGSVVDVKDNGDVNAAITGSGGVSGDNDVQAAITGTGSSGSGSTIPVMAAITGTGSSGSGTTIPVKSEIFSATGDSNIPVLDEIYSATGDSTIPV